MKKKFNLCGRLRNEKMFVGSYCGFCEKTRDEVVTDRVCEA